MPIGNDGVQLSQELGSTVSPTDLEKQIHDAVRALDELAATQTYDLFRSSGGATLAKGLRAALTLARASAGECRRSRPYSPLRPVLDEDSRLRWCCSHEPEHCG
jgi:hypothetical protein